MSEAEHQATDILLPDASISVFSKDQETLESASGLKDDWRFGRVKVLAMDGDVDSAIEFSKNGGVSDLIIIQTDEIDDSFTNKLGELSAHCDQGTAAIVIGPVNDVYLYRQLIDMGVSDYLVRPVTEEVLTDVIARSLIKRLGVSESRLIAFVGAKGGVGVSSIAQIVTLLSSKESDQKSVLMDAAGGWSSLSVGIGFDPTTKLIDVSRLAEKQDETELDRSFYQFDDNIKVLATGAEAMLVASITPQRYEMILDNLMVRSSVVFVDLSSANATIKKTVIARAHKTIVVTTPTVTSLRFSRSLLQEISSARGGQTDDISLVVNKAGISKAHEVSNSDISNALDFKVSASIPYLPELFLKYEGDMNDMLDDKEASSLVTVVLPVIKGIVSKGSRRVSVSDDDKSGVIGGLLNRFKSKKC